MRSLYWKIFVSFWLTTILTIITTAWVTSEIARRSAIPAHEKLFMDSYANAAIATFESGQKTALTQWLVQIGHAKNMSLFLLSNKGEIIGPEDTPEEIKHISNDLLDGELDEGLLKFGNLIVSHEVLSSSGKIYRLVALSEKPLSHLIIIPWAELIIRLSIAILISGFMSYFLSEYLTKPLRSLGLAAKSIAEGQLNTRVKHFAGHRHDEIATLRGEFNIMAEQLETMVDSKERLLQDISHELRSPLARLQIAIALGRKKMPAVAEKEFSRMELECICLNSLIGEILEFARLDKSTEAMTKTETNIIGLLNQIVDDANFELNKKKVLVTLEAPPTCMLIIDKRLISRAIENIVRNAIKYSPPEEKILLKLTMQEDQKKLLIDILDKGPGVPEEDLENIFNPFYRVDPSREKKTGGFGLGLSIAKKAIELHSGTIEASNNEDGGLRVRITLDYP